MFATKEMNQKVTTTVKRRADNERPAGRTAVAKSLDSRPGAFSQWLRTPGLKAARSPAYNQDLGMLQEGAAAPSRGPPSRIQPVLKSRVHKDRLQNLQQKLKEAKLNQI